MSEKKLFNNILWAKTNLPKVEPEYCIVWERADGGTSVTVPAPEWMAMAMHGGLLPDIEVYHDMKVEWEHKVTGEKVYTQVNEGMGSEWKGGKVVPGHGLHDGPRAPAMTQEEAMEYLLQKDVPRYVWYDHERSNRRKFVICPRSAVSKDRTWRNIWTINQEI
jgi:hypothetical protein